MSIGERCGKEVPHAPLQPDDGRVGRHGDGATLPRYQADAQSGQSLVFAEHACLEYKVPPHTAAFESCVERAARAFDRGQPDLAWTQARLTRDAGQACRVDGDASDKADYVRGVATELDRRTKR